MTVRRGGWLYVYVSNESNQDVYFDDLVVNHKRGPVVETNSYYAFGMEIPGLAAKAIGFAGNPGNRIKYNGKELQSKEFTDGSGLEWEDYGARMYDAQIGRWMGMDPLADLSRRWSCYNYTYDNPIRFIDADGMIGIDPNSSLAEDLRKRSEKNHEDALEFNRRLKSEQILSGESSSGGDDPPSGFWVWFKNLMSKALSFGPKTATTEEDNEEVEKSRGVIYFFGETSEQILDAQRDVISLIPGANIPYISMDLYNGKYSSAGFETLSALPFSGIFGSAVKKLTSIVKQDKKILSLAVQTFEGNSKLRNEANNLISQLAKGNMNPGIGTKNIGKGIFEARSSGGARVYFKNTNIGPQIVGYSNKETQGEVIARLFQIH